MLEYILLVLGSGRLISIPSECNRFPGGSGPLHSEQVPIGSHRKLIMYLLHQLANVFKAHLVSLSHLVEGRSNKLNLIDGCLYGIIVIVLWVHHIETMSLLVLIF